MYWKLILILLTTAATSSGQPQKCDQTPPKATVRTPSDDGGLFHLKIDNAQLLDGKRYFTPLQTYVLTLETSNITRQFCWFMITAEDPDVDNNLYDFSHKEVDVGTLKTLDEGQGKSRYSERCASTVESFDNTPKPDVKIHWVSPEKTDRVRIRAMVAENSENWYIGENLIIILERNNKPPRDNPPIPPVMTCNLCSEARYEVIFNGKWSRLAHPLHYPSKPDENGYSHMVGASHDYNYTLWERGAPASEGMQKLAVDADVRALEREIVDSMGEQRGTRTLIRGKRRHHPHMHEPSHALFRVDRFHHLFSIAVAMKPSPDWFLGTNKFELCTSNGWLEYAELPLYPWDVGTMDGVSYESPRSMTQPPNNIERVEVGSFNSASPFFQMNLNDLKPFAELVVRRLDVYSLDPSECSEEGEEAVEEELAQDEPLEGPRVLESRQAGCFGEWGNWSPCIPDVGGCGIGAQTRTRQSRVHYSSNNENDAQLLSPETSCQANEDPMEIQLCLVEC